jgi:hypothetical protein
MTGDKFRKSHRALVAASKALCPAPSPSCHRMMLYQIALPAERARAPAVDRMHPSLRKQFVFNLIHIHQLHPGKRIIRAAGSSPWIPAGSY